MLCLESDSTRCLRLTSVRMGTTTSHAGTTISDSCLPADMLFHVAATFTTTQGLLSSIVLSLNHGSHAPKNTFFCRYQVLHLIEVPILEGDVSRSSKFSCTFHQNSIRGLPRDRHGSGWLVQELFPHRASDPGSRRIIHLHPIPRISTWLQIPLHDFHRGSTPIYFKSYSLVPTSRGLEYDGFP